MKGLDCRKSMLFKAVFGYLIICDDYKIAEGIIRDLFIVLLSEYANKFCNDALKNLRDLCETHELPIPYKKTGDAEEYIEESNDFFESEADSRDDDGDNSYKSTSTFR